MSSLIKSKEEIRKIRRGGKIISGILKKVTGLVKPGISTLQLDQFAEKQIIAAGGRPAFKNYGHKRKPFPATLCTSVNSVVVHGIPSKDTLLQEGDIIGIDIGMEYDRMYTDTAVTIGVGKISAQAKKLLNTAKRALDSGIAQARAGKRIGDISSAIQKQAEGDGFNVVRDLVGHGVGYELHEEPQVPCYGRPNTGMILQPGMVLAIEPMVTIGSYRLAVADDGWTISTFDRSLAAHFEHTIVITEGEPEILT